MSRSVLSRVLSARNWLTSARSLASSCSGVSALGPDTAAVVGLRCRIATPAALHHAESVASLTPSSAAICVIVAPSVSRYSATASRLNSSGYFFLAIGLDHLASPRAFLGLSVSNTRGQVPSSQGTHPRGHRHRHRYRARVPCARRDHLCHRVRRDDRGADAYRHPRTRRHVVAGVLGGRRPVVVSRGGGRGIPEPVHRAGSRESLGGNEFRGGAGTACGVDRRLHRIPALPR